MNIAKELLALTDGGPSEQLISQACLGSFISAEVQAAAGRLEESLSTWEEETAALTWLIPLDRIPPTRLPLGQSQFEDVLNWTRGVAAPLEAAVSGLNAVESSLFSQIERSPAEILASA